MPTSSDPTSICNLSLSKIGLPFINSMLDQNNPSSIACNVNFQLAYLEVSRASRWNCILTVANLTQVPQTPLPGTPPITSAATWAPNTTYQANTYLTYGGYYYQVEFTYTSTNNFTNDLTTGALVQQNQQTTQPLFPSNGSQYPSGWAFQYALPSDFQLLVSVNANTCTNWGSWDGADGDSSDYEIIGQFLYTDATQAVVQYVQNQPDTTRFDSLFTNCLTLKLASMISTSLRQDGGRMEQAMLVAYDRALKDARTKNAGEKQSRRFNPIGSSLFNAARYRGTNG